MHPAGLAAFERRTADKSAIYEHGKKPEAFDADLEAAFKSHRSPWDFFELRPKGTAHVELPGDVGETGKNPPRTTVETDRRFRKGRAVALIATSQFLCNHRRLNLESSSQLQRRIGAGCFSNVVSQYWS
jgi:hypothetical protein